MRIIIRSEFTKIKKTIEIETRGDRPPTMPEDIIAVDGNRFQQSDLDIEKIYELKYELYEAYKKQELEDKLYYEVCIDVLTAKEFLYDKCIQYYGIIDNIVSASIHDNDINVKWRMDDKEYEYTFEGYGYDLMRIIKLRQLEGVD